MIIYLAGPIDAAGEKTRVDELRNACIEQLHKHGASIYDPSRAFRGVADGAGVVRINEAAWGAADGMLAFLPDDVRSIGTPIEIYQATEAGLPVAVVCESRPSVQLIGMGVPTYGTGSVAQAVADLAQDILRRGRHQNARRDHGRPANRIYGCAPSQETEGPGKAAETPRRAQELPWTGAGEPPVQQHQGDAGFDLVCSSERKIRPGTFCDIPCDVHMGFPPGTWGLILGRSSTLRNRALLVPPAVIDQGYRGELFANVWNLGEKTATVKPGERIAQLVPMPALADGLRPRWVEQLDQTERGTNGFGSTGT